MITLFFYLVVAHAAFDYALQGDTVALNKNPNAKTLLQNSVPWFYWMASHALMHGGAVCIITGSVYLGMAEVIAHFIIDYCKCMKMFTIHIDQLLHVACKIIWLVVLYLIIR